MSNDVLHPLHTIIEPHGHARPNFFVADLFQREVILHIVKNNIRCLRPPIMLGIQGPRGEGKTEMLKEVCEQMGVWVVDLPGSALGGETEGRPVKILIEAYNAASILKKANCGRAVLLIDDIDTSVAAVAEGRRYTVNSQLLSGALMSLADKANINRQGETETVPIIVTGNNLSLLYNAVTRHGRMRIYTWQPNLETKKDIVRKMFEGYLVHDNDSQRQLDKMVERYENQPVAFFRMIRDEAYDDLVIQTIKSVGNYDLEHISSKFEHSRLQIPIKHLSTRASEAALRMTIDYSR